MIPEKLEGWKYEDIDDLVRKNIGESDMHDFKTDIPDSITLTDLCCSFANTKGGFVILGVSENHNRFKIEGITNDKELPHMFGQKIHADPTIQFDLPKIIEVPNSDKVLAIFHIPISSERPHIPSTTDKRIFWKRTNKGKDYMTYQEIRMSFQNYEERREKIKLLYNELLTNVELLEVMRTENISDLNNYSFLTLDSQVITSLLTDLYTVIGKNKELIILLNTIRVEIRVIDNKVRVFLVQIALPLSNKENIIKNHNEFINSQADFLVPKLRDAIKILERDFGLVNPNQ